MNRKLATMMVIVAGIVAYHNSFTGPFVFDDVPSTEENLTIRSFWPIWRPLSPPHGAGQTVQGRPIVNLSLAMNFALGGLEVVGYHIVNLAVHILASLVLLGILRRTLRPRYGPVGDDLAFAIAMLWTVHPLQTESVTYIIQRAESIMGLFYLLTLYCFIRGVTSEKPGWWYCSSVGACAVGMGSKEVMVSAPVIVLVYDRAFLCGSFREAWQLRRRVYVGLFSTWIVLGMVLIAGGTVGVAAKNAQSLGVTWWQYLLTESRVILHYARLALWPYPQCLDFGWPVVRCWTDAWPSMFVVGMVLGALIWIWRENPATGFLGAWFFLILVPTSSFFPLDSPSYEHRMYLSLAAVICAVVLVAYTVVGRRSVILFSVVFVVLLSLTIRRNEVYRSASKLWADTAGKQPSNSKARFNCANALKMEGRFDEAVNSYERALEIQPSHLEAHTNLGLTLWRLGKLQEAVSHLQQALVIKPDFAEGRYNLASAYLQMGRTDDARIEYEQATRLRPDFPQAQYAVGRILAAGGQFEEAIERFKLAIRYRPDYPEAQRDLGITLMKLGKFEEAVPPLQSTLRLKADDPETQYAVAALLARQGREDEAIEHLQAALRLAPNSDRYKRTLEAIRQAKAQK